MNELDVRLKENYLQEIKEFVEFMRTKGYVLIADFGSTNIRLNCYRADTGKFAPIKQMFEIPSWIKEKVPDYYKLDVDKEIVNIIREVLPVLEHEDINSYLMYLKYSEGLIPTKELKHELKELRKMSKDLMTNIDVNNYHIPYVQADLLNKEFVIYNDSKKGLEKGYYIYNKKSDDFKKLDDKDIALILQEGFGVGNFTNFEIHRNMKNVYLHRVVNSDLPTRWNTNQRAISICKNNKEGYERIKKVTDKFR